MEFKPRSELERKQTDALIRELYAADTSDQKKLSKNIRPTDYVLSNDHHGNNNDKALVLTSWKFNEWDYKKDPCPFPTLARGLFSRKLPSSDQYDIVIRGYDKFFNIGEVKRTKWDWIESETKGLYEVTVKENGCIIFMTGIGDRLIVTSKHSVGKREDVEVAHSVKGEEWVIEHLNRVGKKVSHLARFLCEHDITAVGELCDDTFEEHVLPYTKEQSGIYLHGINRNTVTLTTFPSNTVQKFAREWGFYETEYISFDTIEEVKKFTNQVRNQGEYKGRPIEGFVVRCKTNDDIDFFFKVKYDEPYLMYREWREITKAILAGKDNVRTSRKESRSYATWVKDEIERNPQDFIDFRKGRGIIAIRERFMKWYDTEGKTNDPGIHETQRLQDFDKTLLVPIATPGCGKTSLALVLARLFGFGHVQNDNIKAKKNVPKIFVSELVKELNKHNVVIADKNNHQFLHRSQILPAISREFPNCRFIALYFPHNELLNDIFKITSNRIINRGENHQSLTPANPELEVIIWRFLKQFAPVDSTCGDDNLFDEVIELPISNDVEQNVRICIQRLVSIIGLKQPTDDEIESALIELTSYRPTVRKVVRGSTSKQVEKKPAKAPRYIGVEIRDIFGPNIVRDLKTSINKVSNQNVNLPILPENKYKKDLHITLVHTKEVYPEGPKNPPNEEMKTLWNELEGLIGTDVHLKIDHLVWDQRLVAVGVNTIVTEGNKPIKLNVNRRMHITLGIANESVNAFEANALMEKATNNTSHDDVHVLDISSLVSEVKGTIRGFIS